MQRGLCPSPRLLLGATVCSCNLQREAGPRGTQLAFPAGPCHCRASPCCPSLLSVMWVPARPSSLHFQHCSTLDKTRGFAESGARVPLQPASMSQGRGALDGARDGAAAEPWVLRAPRHRLVQARGVVPHAGRCQFGISVGFLPALPDLAGCSRFLRTRGRTVRCEVSARGWPRWQAGAVPACCDLLELQVGGRFISPSAASMQIAV